MSYIPDYRKETDKLNETDRAYIAGYRAAIDDALNFFNNLDVYEVSEEEEKVLSKAKECIEDWMEMEETETVLSLFDNADYLPDDIDLVDANKPLYQHTKGAKND